MLLGFKTQHAGRPTNFPAKILLSNVEPLAYEQEAYNAVNVYEPKIHTLRTDEKRRWHVGRQIHFATGILTKNCKVFATATCTGVQPVFINGLYIPVGSRENPRAVIKSLEIRVGETMRILGDYQAQQFALNDGFDTWQEFFDWFSPLVVAAPGGLLSLQLIHWTDLRY